MKKQSKQLRWLGDSLDAVMGFSDEAKRSVGHQLSMVQVGLDPLDWKPKTRKKDIDLAAGRYKALMKERNKK